VFKCSTQKKTKNSNQNQQITNERINRNLLAMSRLSICGLLCMGLLCILAIPSIQVAAENIPSESECRPHIEKALNTIKADNKDHDDKEADVLIGSNQLNPDDTSNADSNENSNENDSDGDPAVVADENSEEAKDDDGTTQNDDDNENSNETTNDGDDSADDKSDEVNVTDGDDAGDSRENASDEKTDESNEDDDKTNEKGESDEDEITIDVNIVNDNDDNNDDNDGKSDEDQNNDTNQSDEVDTDDKSGEVDTSDDSKENVSEEKGEESNDNNKSSENDESDEKVTATGNANDDDDSKSDENDAEANVEQSKENDDNDSNEQNDDDDSKKKSNASEDDDDSDEIVQIKDVKKSTAKRAVSDDSNEISTTSYPVDDLLLETEIPENLRDRSHITEILHLDEESFTREQALQKVADNTLKDLKKIYENSIKPLETLYKYRDLSNRHFGDPEIFSKPLILFMGPWSGGKSTILNYLTENEYTDFSLRTGAEPSPAYFNLLMYGDTPEVLDGTQLAADWTFSGLQKFGQGLQDRLRGLKLPSNILKKVNIVEIPGILEVRKQVSRLFPFNDACQWFIDRADIIFLVYDPSKLDVGPETEAILDQLKGREYQTRIVLNKADTVHPEELLRVQSALIWNISPLMSSAQPPIMYTTSLWSHPFQDNAPVRLLQAQEKALLQDLAQAINYRIENKIASARRFAVRVRNHAKMVDCYLTTYYNHKTLFGNKKKISGEIVEHPQNYHIYEGLSTLTNISRYDLPDPDTYRDFFRLNALYEFKKLSETCTYFRGCPINKLDVAIAYDLPELVNRYKRAVEQALNTLELSNSVNDTSTNSR